MLSEESGVLQERIAGLEEEVRVLRERLQQFQSDAGTTTPVADEVLG